MVAVNNCLQAKAFIDAACHTNIGDALIHQLTATAIPVAVSRC